MRRLRDPLFVSMAVLFGLGLAGVLAAAMSWRGVASETVVAKQMPFMISGSIAGLAMVGVAAVVIVIQHRRWLEARRRAEFDALVQAAGALLVVARRNRTGERS